MQTGKMVSMRINVGKRAPMLEVKMLILLLPKV